MNDLNQLKQARDKLREKQPDGQDSDQVFDLQAAISARDTSPKQPAPQTTAPVAHEEPDETIIDLTSDEPTVETPTKTKRTPKPKAANQTKTQSVPPPVFREPGQRLRINVKIPTEFNELRTHAKQQHAMTSGHLVMSALAQNADTLRTEAEQAPIAAYQPTNGRSSWQLLVSEPEIEIIDKLADDLARAMGGLSRAGTIVHVLARC